MGIVWDGVEKGIGKGARGCDEDGKKLVVMVLIVQIWGPREEWGGVALPYTRKGGCEEESRVRTGSSWDEGLLGSEGGGKW